MPTISTGSSFQWPNHPVQRVRMQENLWANWNVSYHGIETTTGTTTYTPAQYTTEWVERTWNSMWEAWEYKVTDQATGRTNSLLTGHPDVDPMSVPGPAQLVTSTGDFEVGTIESRHMHPHQGLTPEQVEERRREMNERRVQLEREYEERRAREQREYVERQARKDAAQARSLELLKLVLNAEEYERYENTKTIEITGSAGGRYVIEQCGYEGNVNQIDDEGVIMRLCAHPVNRGRELPHGDMWVGQVLAIKTDEEHFLATANVHWSREPVRPRPRPPRTNNFGYLAA